MLTVICQQFILSIGKGVKLISVFYKLVIAVLLFHLNSEYLPGGFSGVDIFFVISGYVISRSFVNQQKKKMKDFVLFFYEKRFVRIVPALLLTLLTGVFLYTLFVPLAFLSDSIKNTALAAFWGVSNFALIASWQY